MSRLGVHLAAKPHRAIWPLCVLAVLLEVGQFWPEVVPGGHIVSVFGRAVIYSLIAALIFNWIVVDIPQRRRRRVVYEYNKTSFEILLMAGPTSLVQYNATYPPERARFDVWDEGGVTARAEVIANRGASFFGPERSKLMGVTIMSVQYALDGIRASQSFLSLDVAHAISMFPGTTGLNQLQIEQLPNGHISWKRDAHIVWQLTVAARRLYLALREDVPEIDFGLGEVELNSGKILKVPVSYLAEEAA